MSPCLLLVIFITPTANFTFALAPRCATLIPSVMVPTTGLKYEGKNLPKAKYQYAYGKFNFCSCASLRHFDTNGVK
jgi:hypothetical protein